MSQDAISFSVSSETNALLRRDTTSIISTAFKVILPLGLFLGIAFLAVYVDLSSAIAASGLQTPLALLRASCVLNETEFDTRLLRRANKQYHANVQKRLEFFNGRRPLKANLFQLFLGEFVPSFPCPRLVRVGNFGDGGKWICDMPLLYKNTPPVVVSVGSFGMFDFELDIFRRTNARVFTFDPFLNASQLAAMRRQQRYLQLFEVGLSGARDLAEYRRQFPNKTFTTFPGLLRLLNVSHIDILKVDCEGCEFGVVQDLLELYGATRRPPIGQFDVEVHRLQDWTLQAFFYPMDDLGFRIQMNELNPCCGAKLMEFSYIHESIVEV